jgi:hypothetical protein
MGPVLKQLGLIADGVFLVTEEPKPEVLPAFTLPADFQVLTRAYDDLDYQAQQYLQRRGVTPTQIKQYRIGVSYSGRYAYRILFPIYAEGKLRGVNARDFTGHQQPKYLLSSGEKYLYGFNPKAHTVILSEGVIKALRIAQVASNACSAALLGHHLTETQLGQLEQSSCQHAIVYPDPERVGYAGAAAVAARLVEHWQKENAQKKVSVVRFVTTPADDAPLPVIQRLLKQHVEPYNTLTHNQLIRGQ